MISTVISGVTVGKERENSARMSERNCVANSSAVPSLTVPRTGGITSLPTASSLIERMRLAYPSNCSPAGVGTTLRPLRSHRRAPT